jgi:hypothetical protein
MAEVTLQLTHHCSLLILLIFPLLAGSALLEKLTIYTKKGTKFP